MTPEMIERIRKWLNEDGDHVCRENIDALCDLALRALRPEPPVAWRWHWIGGDEPDVWAYSDTMPRHSKDVVCEPLYAVPLASPAAQPNVARQERNSPVSLGDSADGQEPSQEGAPVAARPDAMLRGPVAPVAAAPSQGSVEELTEVLDKLSRTYAAHWEREADDGRPGYVSGNVNVLLVGKLMQLTRTLLRTLSRAEPQAVAWRVWDQVHGWWVYYEDVQEASEPLYLAAAPQSGVAPAWKRDAHFGGDSYEASLLRHLLARIHRDGGHYLAAHGLEKAYEDADRIVADILASAPAEKAHKEEPTRMGDKRGQPIEFVDFAAEKDEARDAARYRLWRSIWCADDDMCAMNDLAPDGFSIEADWDAILDAALAAPKEKPHG